MLKNLIYLFSILLVSCSNDSNKKQFAGMDGEVRLIIVDPGHFHASLAQKYRLDQIHKDVYVYAPKGKELDAYLNTIQQYNSRENRPSDWNIILYEGEDYMEKMLIESKGNVVVLAGDNRKKIDYIQKSLEAGLNVLTDKPMIIIPEKLNQLEASYKIAKQRGVLLYDMMTERYDLINQIQSRLMNNEALFGKLEQGTPDEPAILSESTHHFLKNVSGKALIRLAWYYNTDQQGEGIVDVTTHLIDLITFNCFQNKQIDPSKVIVNKAEHYPTKISLEDFNLSTMETDFPTFLNKYITKDTLSVYANGSIQYSINGIQIKVKVEWKVKAESGAGDTQRFIVKGSKADLLILQDAEQGFTRQLYVRKKDNISENDFQHAINGAIKDLQSDYPELLLVDENGMKHFVIPSSYTKGHEEHFNQVVQSYLDFLKEGQIPENEINNTLVKYSITTKALEMARK